MFLLLYYVFFNYKESEQGLPQFAATLVRLYFIQSAFTLPWISVFR